MRIVIFGVGNIFQKNKDRISGEDRVIAYLDNNVKIHGEKIDGIEIYSPEYIKEISYEKIVVMSDYGSEMKRQLLELGCAREDILHFTEYLSRQSIGKMEIHFGNREWDEGKKGLIITSSVGYHGGAIAAVYMAFAMQNKGYNVTIAATEGNAHFIDEFRKQGITFALYPNLQFAKWKELLWIQQFETVIFNTYPMILCALEVCRYRKAMFWLHESNVVYDSMDFWKDLILDRIPDSGLVFFAVSKVAKRNFENNIVKYNIGILPYGIPDIKEKNTEMSRVNAKLCFAVIGTVYPTKRQMLFLDAVNLLRQSDRRKCEFQIIGRLDEASDYGKQVKKKSKVFDEVQIVGELTREELAQAYHHIDILVIPSEAETMSLVATESMMYGKVCILCNVAGMAEYVVHGQNGLLFQTDDAISLARQMEFCIHDRNTLVKMGATARKTYERNFAMEVFEKRLDIVKQRE